MKKQIVVEVSDQAEIHIETRGFTGASCIEESQFLKDLLGTETAKQLSPAYYNRGRKIVKKHIPICG